MTRQLMRDIIHSLYLEFVFFPPIRSYIQLLSPSAGVCH
uniref:Uncharacterized protein n=1 Tax=Anguilla anguilla TaxID=7936 RepID=A0A0E9XHE3_ANGAN